MSADPKLLWRAIATLRSHGVSVWHREGEGICAIWDVGPLRGVGRYGRSLPGDRRR